MEWSGRRVWVSGAASGAGAAVCALLQAQGAQVLALDRVAVADAVQQLVLDLADGAAVDAALAAVIGDGAVARTEVVKKVWDYVKAHNLQDPKDKRVIVADAKLLPVFGKDRINMFELTGIVGKHLVSND